MGAADLDHIPDRESIRGSQGGARFISSALCRFAFSMDSQQLRDYVKEVVATLHFGEFQDDNI
jgi:hypothetical protein